jgi:hypothetical protein
VPRRLTRYDIALDADGRWCVVLDAQGCVAVYYPALRRRGVLEPPVRVVDDPVPFLRVQGGDSSLIGALIAWHVCEGRDVPGRVEAALRAALPG